MRRDFAVDIDGTVANTQPLLRRRLSVPRTYRDYDLAPFGATPGFFESHDGLAVFGAALPVRGSLGGVHMPCRLGPVAYVSRRPETPRVRLVTVAWLMNLKFPVGPVILGEDKVSVAVDLGVWLLIDDQPEEVAAARVAGLAGVVLAQYNRRTDQPRSGWSSITRVLDRMQREREEVDERCGCDVEGGREVG